MDWNLQIFRPDECRNSIAEIDFRQIKANGFKAIIFDLDETLLPRHVHGITPKLYSFIEELKDLGFKLCLVSNNFSPARVQYISDYLKIPCLTLAFKPLPFSFNKAVELLGIKSSEAVIVGDQLFMDILGGKLAGLYTILVKPISGETFWVRKLMRWAEDIVLKRINSGNF
ncbi:MAG: yqeG [Candidatus Saganbacteria bacterium]|uniref:YqeG n=1 Tax=Candidatus Saganbacteria bacterium TaxID=2575572 RepID=A0A833P3I0_UNCSA|nr:MAG: yqeG [Candidatus Saganbacteria bacterium]